MKNLLCVIMLFIGVISSAQEYERGTFRVKLKSDDAKPAKLKSTGKISDNEKVNQIFKKHNVITYEQAYPFAKNPELLKIYKVKITGNDDNFKKELDNAAELFYDVEQIPVPNATYDPSDHMWYLPSKEDPNGWLWHLKRIQADLAWDITKSNSNIRIGSVDTDFDILHPDLSAKIVPHYDPMTNIVHSTRGDSHGTRTSSFAAAHTDGGGQLAAVGFNSTIVAYTWSDGVAKALHASTVMNVDVITISWFYTCNDNYDNFHDDSLMIKEILDNGTIIVASAGNGPAHCSGGSIYPFSPLVDSRIICVTSTGKDDKHSNSPGVAHSGYPSVSISSPGYSLVGAASTINADGSTSTWPYAAVGGTSHATPIVAGVCALMKSINPCLTASTAKAIIQATADPVLDASSYPNMVGAGRVNAYNAVKSAGTKSEVGSLVSGTYAAGYAANLTNLTIQNNANINIVARNEINITGTFDVPLGSSMELNIDPTAINSCNW